MQDEKSVKREMKKLKNSYYWFALFAFCFIAYQQIIDSIRPNYSGDVLTIKYFLGIAPNFFAALGIPALFVILIPQMKSSSKWLSMKRHITANIISLTGLISWEIVQAGSKKMHFDWNDILWTIIGGLIFQLIWILTPDNFKTT